MWISKLKIDAFRRLTGDFAFSSGLNVVIGDNEAGKSSLHEALVRLLFGFSKAERRRYRGTSVLERVLPWDGRPCRVIGFLEHDERLRVEWEFGPHRVRVYDAMGKDISEKVGGKGDDVRLGEHLLGIGVDDFRQVCCIDQEALFAVRHSPSLGVALQEAVANVGGETPVETAVERLNDFLRSSVGARVDTLSPSPTGTLLRLQRERAGLLEELARTEAVRRELVEVSAEQARMRDEHERLLVERAAVEQRRLVAEAEQLEQRAGEVERLGAEASAAADDGEPDLAVFDEVLLVHEQLEQRQGELTHARREAEAVSGELEALERRQRELIAEVDGLAAYASLDVSHSERVGVAWGELRALETQHEPPPSVPDRDPRLERYRAERDRLRAQAEGERRLTPKRLLWLALVALTVGLALGVRKLVLGLRARATAPEDPLARYGAASLAELDRRVADEDRRVAAAQALIDDYERKRNERSEARSRLENELTAVLDQAGARAAPLDQRAQAYLLGSRRHGEHVEKAMELERVRRRVGETRKPADDLARVQREVETIERRFRDACVALGVRESDTTEAWARVERLREEAQREARRVQRAAAARQALNTLLAGETPAHVADRLEQAQARLAEHRAVHGPLASGLEPADPAQLDKKIRAAERSLGELGARAERLEQDAGDPAALKERLAEVDARLARLEEAKEAVALARAMLQQTADELRREFAPHLNEALKRNLARITGDRYREASVAADLSVHVVVPETAQLKSADDLSRATKDQLFLVQRLEIARLLSPTKGVAPLLLDDPFAHYDGRRLARGLEILAEASADRQIVLFTEDPDVARLAREQCETCRIVELEAPPAGA